MTATARRPLPALIRHAALLAGILAIVAGILGMHTLTGTHAAHTLGPASPPSSAAAPVSMAPAGGHSHGHSHGAHAASDAPAGSAAACTGSFTGTELPGAACTPLAKAGSLAAPAPGSAGQLAYADIGSGVAALRSYTYLPAGPSPGDLSISRT